MSAPLQSILQQLKARLQPLSETAGLDAQVLLAEVIEKPRAWLLAHPEAQLTPEQVEALEHAVHRLEAGEPLPYVLGRWEFFGLDFRLQSPAPSRLSSSVLIPRPETELLVERALAWLHQHPHRRAACDVGTGSGCIAITLAVHVADLRIIATDLSPAALQVAQANARRYGVEGRILFVQADLLPPGANRFDLICANLPYIPTEKLRSLPVFTREPALALDGGPDGLRLIRRLVRQTPARLSPGGLLLLEIEASQGVAVTDLARETFPTADIRVHPDLAGLDRMVEVQVLHR